MKWLFYICNELQKFRKMFEFQQYLGFLLFLTILTIGFWLMIFLVGFVHYWLGGAIMELIKEKRSKKDDE